MTTSRKILFAFLSIGLSVFVCLIVLEILFRFLPVNEGLQTQNVTFADSVQRYKPNQEITWSRGPLFSIVNTVRTNNAGFVNNQDYVDTGKPVLGVIGDSFVVAAMVPYPETLHGRLAKTADGKGYDVYSFAGTGAPLSQYLVWAQHAQEHYNIEKLVIVVVGNDFDESLPAYGLSQTHQQFVADQSDALRPKLMREYKRAPIKDIVRHSALLRYLSFNLKIQPTLAAFKRKLQGKAHQTQTFVGNTKADTSEQRVRDSKIAVETFLKLLPDYSGLKPEDILFVLDAPRELLYEAEKLPLSGDSYFEQMRLYFMKQARSQGHIVVDLEAPFFYLHRAKGTRFEFPTDGHWSGIGHGIAHEYVLKSRWFQDFERDIAQSR